MMEGMSAVGSAVAVALEKSHHRFAPTKVRACRFRSQFDSSIVGSSSRVSMEGSFDKCPPEARELEARESMAKPGIEDIEREAMVRKKRIIEAGGREEKSPGMENSPPGIQELMDMMDYDDAAEWQQICDDAAEWQQICDVLRKKQKRDEMKSGGPET